MEEKQWIEGCGCVKVLKIYDGKDKRYSEVILKRKCKIHKSQKYMR